MIIPACIKYCRVEQCLFNVVVKLPFLFGQHWQIQVIDFLKKGISLQSKFSLSGCKYTFPTLSLPYLLCLLTFIPTSSFSQSLTMINTVHIVHLTTSSMLAVSIVFFLENAAKCTEVK